MSTTKQAVLPLWGNGRNARAVHMNAVGRFTELCSEFLAADLDKNEAEMDRVCHRLRAAVNALEQFKRSEFRKWAKDREAGRL